MEGRSTPLRRTRNKGRGGEPLERRKKDRCESYKLPDISGIWDTVRDVMTSVQQKLIHLWHTECKILELNLMSKFCFGKIVSQHSN